MGCAGRGQSCCAGVVLGVLRVCEVGRQGVCKIIHSTGLLDSETYDVNTCDYGTGGRWRG